MHHLGLKRILSKTQTTVVANGGEKQNEYDFLSSPNQLIAIDEIIQLK